MSISYLEGKRFGKLVVIEKTEKRDAAGIVIYKCVCDCGAEVFCPTTNLTKQDKYSPIRSCKKCKPKVKRQQYTPPQKRDLDEGELLKYEYILNLFNKGLIPLSKIRTRYSYNNKHGNDTDTLMYRKILDTIEDNIVKSVGKQCGNDRVSKVRNAFEEGYQTSSQDPLYRVWFAMIARSESQKVKSKNKSYIDVECCEEWKLFSNFRQWAETQDWEGRVLDKDLLVYGNKIYSPKTCLFIDQRINSFIPICPKETKYLGVTTRAKPRTLSEELKPYSAKITDFDIGKRIHLGSYSDPLVAHKQYQLAKAKTYEKLIAYAIDHHEDLRAIARLQEHLYNINNDIINGNISTKESICKNTQIM